MKVIEFIKRNISVFNIIAISVFIISSFILINIKAENSYHGLKVFFLILSFLFSIILLIIDFVVRKIIKNESKKSLIKLILYPIIFILLIYFIYIILS
jgi:hypothetical protein